jgi:hypothetical protein
MKQILSVVLGVLTVVFICNEMKINNEVALFLFAVFNLFIMLMANIYALVTKVYSKEIRKRIYNANVNTNNSVFLHHALGVGIKNMITNLTTKDILVAIFFCVCPIISLWMFTTTFSAAYYDILNIIEQNTIQKLKLKHHG